MTLRRWAEVGLVTLGVGFAAWWALAASPVWAIVGLVVASLVLSFTIGAALRAGSDTDDANEEFLRQLERDND